MPVAVDSLPAWVSSMFLGIEESRRACPLFLGEWGPLLIHMEVFYG